MLYKFLPITDRVKRPKCRKDKLTNLGRYEGQNCCRGELNVNAVKMARNDKILILDFDHMLIHKLPVGSLKF